MAERGGRTIAIVAGVATAAAGLGTLFARRAAAIEGISPTAWLALKAAAAMGGGLDDPAKRTRAIARNQAAGPARLPRRLAGRIAFREARGGGDIVFHAAPDSGVSPIRLFYLHGGALVFELMALQWRLVAGLMDRTGAATVIPIYPLAPDYGWEDGQAMVRRSFDAIAAEAGAGNIAIVADSAGAALALSLVQALKRDGATLPGAMVLFSPWLDLGCSGPDQPALEANDPALTLAGLRACGRMWARDVPLDDPRVSPLFGDVSGLPPTLVFAAGRDVLASDARRLVMRNPAVRIVAESGMFHDWPIAPIPEGRRALDQAAAFIRDTLKAG